MPRKIPEAQRLVQDARRGANWVPAPLPDRATCQLCGTTTWAASEGRPSHHLRASRPGEENYSTEVPTMTRCEGSAW